MILFLYCVLPMQRQRLRDVWPGALVAVLLLALCARALELYFEHLADFGALYGSLGALMALLLFVYAPAMVLLFGAEFASEWTRLPDGPDPRSAAEVGTSSGSASASLDVYRLEPHPQATPRHGPVTFCDVDVVLAPVTSSPNAWSGRSRGSRTPRGFCSGRCRPRRGMRRRSVAAVENTCR